MQRWHYSAAYLLWLKPWIRLVTLWLLSSVRWILLWRPFQVGQWVSFQHWCWLKPTMLSNKRRKDANIAMELVFSNSCMDVLLSIKRIWITCVTVDAVFIFFLLCLLLVYALGSNCENCNFYPSRSEFYPFKAWVFAERFYNYNVVGLSKWFLLMQFN